MVIYRVTATFALYYDMKGVLFLASHLGSGSDHLFRTLASLPRIEGIRTGMSYDHYDKIESLVANPHKYNKSNAIWMDELLYNHSFTCKHLLPYLKFVFVLREPAGSLAQMVAEGWSLEEASRYYRYRLVGLCEYAVRSRGLVLTHDRMGDVGRLAGYLALKGSETEACLSLKAAVSLVSETVIPSETLLPCERAYERHLGHLITAGLLT